VEGWLEAARGVERTAEAGEAGDAAVRAEIMVASSSADGGREREREREAGAARQWQLAASSSLYGLTRRRWQRGEECGWRLRGA